MGAFGTQKRPRGEMGPKPSIFLRFKATSREGAPKNAFARKVTLFAKKSQMVEFHYYNGSGWNIAKMALFRENGAPRRPNSLPWPERYGRRMRICRIGPAQTRTGGLATPSKRSAVRRRTASPFPSLQSFIYGFVGHST